MEYMFVGIGGLFGSITRYVLGRIISRYPMKGFPIGTFIINITGAVFLGVLSSLPHGHNTFLVMGDGFLGAYTTFSTFMYEGFSLFKDRKKINMITYMVSSILLGILGFVCGSGIGAFLY